MAQITSVTSELLQAKIRELLPSQQGFGEDLQATNVITPVIDLTAAAEGSDTPTYLQTALAFGSQTAFNAVNATVVVANSPGFFRIFGSSTTRNNATDGVNSFTMTDGLSVKTVWSHTIDAAPTTTQLSNTSLNFDFTVFLATGESISAVSNKIEGHIIGSSRQVANVNGTLTNPSGFTPQ